MTDYTPEQRKADAETLRYALVHISPDWIHDGVRQVIDRLDPAPPPMTLREALRSLTGWRTEWPDQALAVVADPAHRAEVLALLGEPAEAAERVLYGQPRTGEPLSEGEQQRFEAAVERGLRKRAEDRIGAALRALATVTDDEYATVVARSIERILTSGEPAPQPASDPACSTCGHPMTVSDLGEGWRCARHPRAAAPQPAPTNPEEGQ